MKEVEKNWPRLDDLEGRAVKIEDDLREFYKNLISLQESYDKTTDELNIWMKENK